MSSRRLKRLLQEAHLSSHESDRTGVPIDEVIDRRREQQVERVGAQREIVEEYNDAAARVRGNGSPEDRGDHWLAWKNFQRANRGQELLPRRDFLRLAGIAAAAVAMRPRKARAASGPRIAIVGGGLAGLRCAHKLWIERGLASTVYDAQNVGGRCQTIRGFFANNQIAEAHGEFISSEHSSVLALGSRYALGKEDLWAYPNGTEDTFWMNGARYTQSQVTADWKAFGYNVFHDAVQQVPSATYNSFSALARSWDNQDVITWLDQHLPGGAYTNFGRLCQEAAIGNFGGPLSDTSALGCVFMLGYNTSGNNKQYQSKSYMYASGTDERWHHAGGNDQMISGMVGELPAGSIRTGMALAALKDNGTSYTLTFRQGTSTVTVVADHVVLALPFSALRDVDLKRSNLSALKKTAISQLGMGTSGKVICQFTGHPWVGGGFDGNCLADSPTNWIWEMNYQVNNNSAPTGILVQYPGAGVTQQYVSQYRASDHEGVSPAGLATNVLDKMETVFPGSKAKYNGKSYYHFGLNDPWVKGGYSYWRVGQYTTIAGYEQVREGNIHFAGEHTSVGYQGYMEGALNSGERAADEI